MTHDDINEDFLRRLLGELEARGVTARSKPNVPADVPARAVLNEVDSESKQQDDQAKIY